MFSVSRCVYKSYTTYCNVSQDFRCIQLYTGTQLGGWRRYRMLLYHIVFWNKRPRKYWCFCYSISDQDNRHQYRIQVLFSGYNFLLHREYIRIPLDRHSCHVRRWSVLSLKRTRSALFRRSWDLCRLGIVCICCFRWEPCWVDNRIFHLEFWRNLFERHIL